MKHKYLLFGLLSLAACTQDNLPVPEENTPETKPEIDVDGKYLATLPDFIVESAGETVQPHSRIGIDVSKNDNKYHITYKWQNDDVIGIFPKGPTVAEGEKPLEGDQVYFNVIPDPTKNDGKTATFDGGGWDVKKGYTYWAYCPFNRGGGFGQNKTKMPIDFTKQVWNKENNYLSKRVYMLSEGKMTEGNFNFDFKPLTCLGICKIVFKRNPWASQGYLKSLTFEFTDGTKPFVETGTFDVTKAVGVGEGQDLPVDVITATTTSNTFTLTAPLEETERLVTSSTGDVQWLFSQAALQGIAEKTCRVTLKYVSTHPSTKDQEITYFTDFTFSKDWVPGHAYVLELSFPWIEQDKNTINVRTPGSLRLSQVQAAMNGSGKLVVNGYLNDKDFEVLRQAAGAGAQAARAGEGATLLTDLDLWNANFEQEYDALPVTIPSFAGTKLTRIVLPSYKKMSVGAETFKDVPLNTLEWDIYMYEFPVHEDYTGTIDSRAFDGLATENCDLKIDNKFFKYISADADGNMLFNGKKFKSYQERSNAYNYDAMANILEYFEIKTLTVDAGAHSINAHFAGFLTEANITEALAGGTTLKVTGNLNDRDLTTIGTAAGAKLTSLTFETEYVPNDAATVFANFTNSANCDLVIPDTWKSKVSADAEGKVMFGGVAWKSIKDTTGKNIIDNVNPTPGIDSWTPGEGGDLEIE